MNEERRKLLESILDKALDAAPADRAAVIEEHCAGDASCCGICESNAGR